MDLFEEAGVRLCPEYLGMTRSTILEVWGEDSGKPLMLVWGGKTSLTVISKLVLWEP